MKTPFSVLSIIPGRVFVLLLTAGWLNAGCSGTNDDAARPENEGLTDTEQSDLFAPDFMQISLEPAVTSMRIRWTMSEEVTARIEYGQSAAMGSQSPEGSTPALEHDVTLSGLSSNTPYHIRIHAVDSSGNEAYSSSFITSTLKPAPEVPLLNGLTVSKANTTIDVSFNTTTVTACRLLYGLAEAGEMQTADGPAGLAHDLSISGLTPNTDYHVAVSCGSGDTLNRPAALLVHTEPLDNIKPVLSEITTHAGETSITVDWLSDENARSRLLYGTDAGLGNATALEANYPLVHSHSISALSSNTSYFLQLESTDVTGNTALSPVFIVTTQPAAGGSPPALSAFSIDLTSSSITLQWQSDEAATSQLEYGLTASLGSSTAEETNYKSSHSETAVGLAASTAYYIRAVSRDASANTGYSPTFYITTLPDDYTPPVMGTISFSRSADSISLSWQTNEPAGSGVDYGTDSGLGFTCCNDPTLKTSHSADITGLDADTDYYIRLTGSDGAGNPGSSSTVIIRTLDNIAPAAVSSFDADHQNNLVTYPAFTTTQGTVSATLTWTASAAADFAAYRIYRSRHAGLTASADLLTEITNQATTSYSDDLDDVTYYYYVIYAVDTSGNLSAVSDEVGLVRYPIGNVLRLTKFAALTTDYATNVPAGTSPSPAHYQAPLYFIFCDALGESNGGAATTIKLGANFALYEFVWSSSAHSWNHLTFNGESEFSFNYAVLDPSMVDHLQNIRTRYGGALTLNSSFRSPSRNANLYSGTYTHSRHQFGDAVDIDNPGGTDQATWQTIVDLATAAYHDDVGYGSYGEGASYIEPYNVTGGWIHADWRFERNYGYSAE